MKRDHVLRDHRHGFMMPPPRRGLAVVALPGRVRDRQIYPTCRVLSYQYSSVHFIEFHGRADFNWKRTAEGVVSFRRLQGSLGAGD